MRIAVALSIMFVVGVAIGMLLARSPNPARAPVDRVPPLDQGEIIGLLKRIEAKLADMSQHMEGPSVREAGSEGIRAGVGLHLDVGSGEIGEALDAADRYLLVRDVEWWSATIEGSRPYLGGESSERAARLLSQVDAAKKDLGHVESRAAMVAWLARNKPTFATVLVGGSSLWTDWLERQRGAVRTTERSGDND
jgi:hypothetical protein